MMRTKFTKIQRSASAARHERIAEVLLNLGYEVHGSTWRTAPWSASALARGGYPYRARRRECG
ncbi:MAG: hypothetical protein ACLRWP_03720 [Bilophila wadsworthia]